MQQHVAIATLASPARRCRVSGHFGELLQGRLGASGPVVLVTLPCSALSVEAQWAPGEDCSLDPGTTPVLTQEQVAGLFRSLRGEAPRGRLRLRADMPPGGGAGASTAALLATLRCLADVPMGPGAEAAACLSLEGATDPLMLPHPGRVLWAPRAARAITTLAPLPAFDVLGGFAGAGLRTDPEDMRFADISDLLRAWRGVSDRETLAALCSESARRNHALRGGPDPAPLVEAGRALGALGIAVAHTGTAQALLFRPGEAPDDGGDLLRSMGLSDIVAFRSQDAS
jgi:uncharacterized protein involved in propanediol utilization